MAIITVSNSNLIFSFHVKEKEGPLYEGEIERARTWTKEILARGRSSENIKNDE
jgi:hypothetical protein